MQARIVGSMMWPNEFHGPLKQHCKHNPLNYIIKIWRKLLSSTMLNVIAFIMTSSTFYCHEKIYLSANQIFKSSKGKLEHVKLASSCFDCTYTSFYKLPNLRKAIKHNSGRTNKLRNSSNTTLERFTAFRNFYWVIVKMLWVNKTSFKRKKIPIKSVNKLMNTSH